MPIFSCFLPKAVAVGQTKCSNVPGAQTAVLKPSHALPPTENAKFAELLDALSALEGDGLPLLQGACRTICERLEAAQASVSLLGSDQTATLVACAGLEEQDSLGRRLGACLLDSDSQQSIPLIEAVLQLYQDCPNVTVVFRDRDEVCDMPLPLEWQHLAFERQCRHFAAAIMVSGGMPLGVLSVAARGPSRPACWTTEALRSLALMLCGHARGSQNLADALAALHSATTLSTLVEAVGKAAVQVSTSVAHMGGQVRVAFLPPDAGAAAIFQLQPVDSGDAGGNVTSPLVAWSRRASCEYVMTTNGGGGGVGMGNGGVSRRSTATRGSIDSAIAAALNGAVPLTAEGLRRTSLTEQNNRRLRSRLSFTMPSDTGPALKGHTLPLSGTLLADALAREAAGLCISDCASYVQDKRTFPRDTVLSRGAIMPQSLALATVSTGGRPLLAAYLTYSCTLPQPLLQAVVGKLQQLLHNITPLIISKIQGALRMEWEYLRTQLEETVKRKGSGDATGSGSNHGGIFTRTTSEQETSGKPTGTTAAGCAITVVDAAEPFADTSLDPADCSVTLNDVCDPCAASPFSTLGATATEGAGCADGLAPPPQPPAMASPAARRRSSLLGHPGELVSPAVSPMFAARRLLSAATEGSGVGSYTGSGTDSCDESNPSRPQLTLSSSLGCDGARAAPNMRIVSSFRSVSFRLEAAHKPRGASRLAPIITIMHERLKAAQAAQMTCGRSEARKADLQSLKLLQEIGKGGYGTVYRGMYHGSEVAVKVIQEKELAALKKGAGGDAAGASTGLCTINAEVTLHKQHLHDAIELVASVSVSHLNIVQVLSFFTDCQLQGPDGRALSAGPADSAIDHEGESERGERGGEGYPRLVHMPSLLESPTAGQDILTGGISVALVMEFMDAGSLSDAIINRIFFERLETHPNGTGRSGRGFLAVSMRSVYSTLLEIALALRHMHSLHLVHCDLKPQNVLLKSAPRDPRGFTAKLSDFGLAKTLARDEQGQLVIDEAVASGTITHVAPEVFMGNKSLGAAVDVYAFGIIMFQILCGMRLYDGMSAQEIANAVAHRHLRPVLPSWVPAGYRALAERCWHELPSVRPSAEELVRQLEKLSDFKRRGIERPYSGANTAAAVSGFQI